MAKRFIEVGAHVFITGRRKMELQEVMEKLAASIPMGRAGEPDEVDKAALFLASDDSSFVRGIELFVDGDRAQT